jgi:hypothetical protein
MNLRANQGNESAMRFSTGAASHLTNPLLRGKFRLLQLHPMRYDWARQLALGYGVFHWSISGFALRRLSLGVNIPAPCPPPSVVRVNQERGFASFFHLSTSGSSSVRDATTPAMSRSVSRNIFPLANEMNRQSWETLPLRRWWAKFGSRTTPRCAMADDHQCSGTQQLHPGGHRGQ